MSLRTPVLCLVSLAAQAQILYNPRQDQKAEEVRKLASEVMNGQIFQSQLDNLNALTGPAGNRVFTSAQRAALARLARSVKWGDIQQDLTEMAEGLTISKAADTAKWDAEKKTLAGEVKKAEEALTGIRASEDDVAALASLLKEVSLVDEALQVANGFLKRDPAKISPTDLRVVHEIAESSGRLAELLESAKEMPRKMATVIAKQMQIDLMKAEIEHLTNLIKIEARRTAAMDDMRRIHAQAVDGVACVTTGLTTRKRPCIPGLEDGFAKTDLASSEENIETTLQRYTVRARWYQVQNGDAVRLERTAEEGVRRCTDANNPECAARNKVLEERKANREEKEADVANHKRKLQLAVFALENWAALASRTGVPNRMADLRVSLEDRRYQIKRDSILARGYEMTLLSGAETLAAYSKSGVRAGNIAALVQAFATLGLIPTIALK